MSTVSTKFFFLKHRLLLALSRFRDRKILKLRSEISSIIHRSAYLDAIDRAPDRRLGESSDIAFLARTDFLQIERPESTPEENEKEIAEIVSRLKESSELRQYGSKYHLLTAFYFEQNNSYSLFDEQISEAIEAAQLLDSNSQPLTGSEISSIRIELRNQQKKLKKEVVQVNRERVESEKLQLVEPIHVGTSEVLFLLSLFSSLFICSGFLYNQLLYSGLGINAADFFDLSDYVRSSVDILSSVVISTLIGVAFWAYLLFQTLHHVIESEQFDAKPNTVHDDYFIPGIVLVAVVGLVVDIYRNGEVSDAFLYPLAFFLMFQLFYRIPFWKYVQNRASVGAVVITIAVFSIHIGFRIKNDRENFKADSFEGPYTLVIEDAESDLEYVGQTSKYVFLRNEQKEFIVYPNEVIQEYRVRGDGI